MKKMWKRFVSLLLACTLLAGMLPLSASAAEKPAETEWIKKIISDLKEDKYELQTKTQLSGSDVWMYIYVKSYWDSELEQSVNDTVFIFQPGQDAASTEIPNYDSASEGKPWSTGKPSAIYIADGVTGIGNHAFDGMTTLETLEIEDPTSLKSVGDYAFNGCDKLVGPLDLSGVTDMGKYAFNGCERLGSGENNKGVTLSDELTTIPENAFNTCGLKNVNIPTSCTEIGNNAFANNSLSGELNLPSSLNTIGERAFYRYNSSSDTGGFSSITIPSSVTKIGANAFSGHKSLETVTLEHEDKKNLTIEDGAFGTDTYTAHNYLDSIKVGDITYENVSMGTQFLTKNNVGELLNNGVNCYLGDLKPLEYEKTVLPTCEKEGYHLYKMTLEGASTENEPVKVETQISISAPGHAYEQCPDLPATCTQPQRTHRHCTNLEKGVVRSCELVDEIRQKVDGKGMLGHNYQVTKIENPIIGAGVGDTVITYTCQNWNSDPDQNLHDGENISHTYSWKIEDKPIAASTAHTLEELTLPSVQGVDNTYYASLEWAVDKETLETPLEDGTHPYNVKLVVPGAGLTFPECTGIGDQLLQVTVQVDKIKLDFSQVEFQNNIRYVAQNNGAFGVLNLPEDADITKTEYRKDNGEWTEDAPEENAVNVGEYQVRVTFTYTSSKYLLDTDSHDLQPPAGYTLAAGDELGTGTLTGPYEIKQMTADDLRVSPIGNLTYDGEEHETVQIDGVPVGADVTVQWNDQEGNPQTETYKAEATSMSVAGITNAGTYDVTITVEHGTFEDGSATKYARGVIAKREISTPTANTLGSYTPEKVQIGVNDPTGEYVGIYTVDNNKQINAGTYEATAALLAPNNYKWSTSEGAAVNISYTIPRRVVQKPGVTSSTYTFTGQPIEVLYRTNQSVLDGEYDENGNLTAFWRDYGKEYVVYTATNVQKTDVGTYKVTVALNNKDANNYWWAGQDATDYSFTWKINKQSINAPTVEAADATYTGLAYDAKNKIKILTHTETSEDVLVLGSNHKYYTSQSGGNAIGTPVNAGTYWVASDFDFAEGEKESNYNIVGNNRTSFTINKAPLTLTAPTDGLTATYTGQAITVPAPEIGSYPEHGEQNATLTYTYKLKDSDDAANTAEGELKLTDVGTYTITVQVSDSCRNYTSESKTYEFKITAADQTVRLTQDGSPVENGATISKTLGDDSFTVTGKGYVGENETNAKIAYAVTQSDASDESKDAVVKVDPTRGEVTLLRAGSATITVTAAGSANYGEATATYTITVGKGTPKIQAEDKKIAYDGQQLVESDYQATVSGVEGAVVPSGELSYQFYNTEAGANEGGTEGKIEAPSAVDDYWLRVSYPGDANYLPAHKVVKVTITNADLFVTPDPYNEEYDGIGHAPATFTVKGVGGAALGTNDYTVYFVKKEGQYVDTAPEAEAEGVWNNQLTVQDVADSGQFWYKIEADSYDPYVGEDPITVTVNPKPLQIKKEVTARKPYDGTKEAIVNIGELKTGVDGETVKVTDTRAEYNSPNVERADTITITYKLTEGPNTDLDNYSVSTGGKPIVGGSAEETVTTVDGTPVGITPAPITVAINDQKKVYDGSAPTVSNVKDTDWKVTYGKIYQLVSGTDDNLDITLSVAPDSKNAGTYAITGKWANSNYDVTFTGSWTGEDANNGEAGIYTITPRPISVQIGNAEGFYGDAPVKPSGLLKDISTEDGEGLVKGDSLDQFLDHVVINASPNTDVGSDYTITGTSGEYGNYNVTFASGTYTVKQRPITITISDAESDYGCDLAQLAYSETLSNTYTGSNKKVVFVGDDEDELGITLSTTAKKGSDAGTYSISGTVPDGDVSKNYSITWAGETPWSGSGQDSTAADSAKGTYTIDKAQLKVSVKRSDIYAQYGEEISNPVTFTNESTGQAIALDASDYTALSQAITYEMNPSDGLTQVEGSENAEGKFTVAVTQQMVTVTVNVAATENYEAATEITYHIHASASGSLDVSLPFADLTYNGQPQQLLAQAPELPDDVYIRYKVGEKGTWTKYSDADPSNWQTLVGTGAGDYTVYWETKAGGNYNASSGHETTEIKKADLSATYTGLNGSEVTLVLNEMGDTYTIPLDLTGNKGYTHSNGDGVTFLSGNTDVAIAKNSTATLELRGVAGEAKITINCPGDNNYNPGTFTFTVKVTDQKAEILYDVTGTTRDYNGQPQTIAVKVTAPDSGATVMYWNEKTSAYDLSEPPAYTDVQDDGYTIKFRITAPGYNTVTDKATLKIEPKPIEENMIAGIAGSYTYTGKGITFDDAISVHDEGVLLEKDKDYTITYGANKEVGESESEDLTNGGGYVKITGTGNYTGEVTKYFAIKAVDGSDLTASLDHTFGYYGDSSTNNATVTVMHGNHEVTSDGSNTVSVAVTQFNGAAANNEATVSGQTITFNQVGTYTIEVTVKGNHATEDPIELSYALLPADDGELKLEAENESNVVKTYGEEVDGSITVKNANGDPLTVGTDYTLAYTYTPFVGNGTSGDYTSSVMEGIPKAGMYVVTATGQGGYANSVGTFTFLILQRDLAEADLTVEDNGLVYNQNAQEPAVTVEVTGNPTANDYEVTYYNNVNASDDGAKAVVTAKGNNFTGSKTVEFTIAPKPITGCVVGEILDQYYTGKEVVPPVTIKDSSYTLILGYDYTTACEDKGPGAATVTIKGTGNYTGEVEKTFTIQSEGAPEPSERFDLAVTPSQWTWKDDLTNLRLSVTFGTDKELILGTEYTLEVNGQTFDGTTDKTIDDALAYIKGLKPDEYTITATGVGAYNGSTDTETVTIKKIQPTVTVTATPNSLSGGGKVTLTLKGEKLPAFAKGEDLSDLLTVTVQNGQQAPDLKELEWTENPDGSLTAELTLPNTNETYTFALRFAGDEYYEPASSDAMVVVGQQTSGGGGGSDPGDQPADPDDTGVSDWLNTKDHLAYLAGYPGGTFGPDQNMTRAEAAQMFYNLLLEKDVKITVEFEDVPADAWYAKPVNTLASLGILSGVGNGRFDPERSITRAEFTVIAMKFANTSGGGVNIFSDVNEDDWFYSAVVDSTQYGWINGYPDGTFRPEATISRAEVTVIVNHMLGRAADRPYVIAHEEELNTFGDVNRGHWGYFHVAEATNAHEYHTEDGTESWTGLS